ncbi:MAG: LPS-assembly protein [Gammaproteobacteria bacterium]
MKPFGTVLSVLVLSTLALGLSAALQPVHATQFSQCGPGFTIPVSPVIPNPSPIVGAIDIESDDAQLSDSGPSILQGNVFVRRGTTFVSTDEVHYTRQGDDETIDAIGSLQIWDQGLYLTGSRGRLELNNEITVIEDGEFQLLDAHAHGSAKRVQLTGDDVLKANDATYSTCNIDDVQWLLEADRISLDKNEERGTARNVWVTFKGVPIFFSPYLSFPLSDARKSGVLAPSAGVSSSTGAEVTVPYYFNIAPNLDATLALRSMTDRGFQLQGEFRYLFGWGEGNLSAEFMAHDSKREESRTGVSFTHHSKLTDRWRTDINYGWVSDEKYFEDLGTSLEVSSQSYLEQRADAIYSGNNYYFIARAQRYQTVNSDLPDSSRPYGRLPQLFLATTFQESNLRLNANAVAEVAHFDRRNSMTGVRWDLRPNITFPYRTASGFIVPKAVLRYTGYSLSDQTQGKDDSPNRLIPSFSLDSGLFFDRPLSFGKHKLTQTLEPRAYYLYTPFDNQDDLPVFDTGEYTFSFAQLFREDRFSGADRVSDAHQVTLAVSTRFLDRSSGAELGRLSVGQIRYFSDRKATLPGGKVDTSRGSNLVAEVVANLDERWRVSAGTQWDASENRSARNTVAVRWQPDARRVLNVGYRFVRDAIEQTDVSFAWPVSQNWRAVGRWNYSLENKRTVEAFSGFEYESCCWGLRFVGRHYLSGSNDEYNSGVFVQFVLKGLTSVGNADNFLGRSVPGYHNEF